MATTGTTARIQSHKEAVEAAKEAAATLAVHTKHVLVHLYNMPPNQAQLTRNDLGLILAEIITEDYDTVALWESVKKSVLVREDERAGTIQFEEALRNPTPARLKEFIDRRPQGVCREDLVEFSKEYEAPIAELLRSASVLPLSGWRDSNKKCLMMYPRQMDFKVPLSGTVSGQAGSMYLDTRDDLRNEIRRGDAVLIEGKVFRVSFEEANVSNLRINDLRDLITELGGDCGDTQERDILERKLQGVMRDGSIVSKSFEKKLFPEAARMLEDLNDFSSSSVRDPEPKNKGPLIYRYAFDAKRVPLDRPLHGHVEGVVAYKFGCHIDVRDVYWQIAEDPQNHYTLNDSSRLDEALEKAGLLSRDLLMGLNKNSRDRAQAQAKRQAEKPSARSQKRRGAIRTFTNVHMMEDD